MRKISAKLVFLTTLIWDVLVCQVIRRQNWWDEVEPNLILGAFPTSSSVKRLSELGVCAVVNMCDEFAGPAQEYAQFGIDQLKIPTVDFSEPLTDEIQRAIDYINRHRGKPGSVFVHCKSGRGRSATVVLCWLIQEHDLSPEAAQLRLQKRRGQVLKNLFQRRCVQQFLRSKSNLNRTNITPAHCKSKAVQ